MLAVFDETKRWLLLLPEALVFGLSFAKFKFLARSRQPLDAERAWRLFTKPKGLMKLLEGIYPPDFFKRIGRRLYYRNTRMFKDHAYGIAKHFDLSNDFYGLFLDRRYMFYTYGDFVKQNDTLEDAQENKADYIVRLIDPKPGEKILDLGCGWGGMLQKVYSVTGDKQSLVGYNLSKEQNKHIQERFGFRVEYRDVIATDYEEASFDKIYAVGLLEHVREGELPGLARKLAMAIKPGGRIVLHFFCQLDELPHPVLLVGGLDVFPGSELSSLKVHMQAFEAANFRITHHSIHDYRPTLKAWFERLVENRAKAIRLVGVQNYNRFLCYLAGAWSLFDIRHLLPVRVVLEPRAAATLEH